MSSTTSAYNRRKCSFSTSKVLLSGTSRRNKLKAEIHILTWKMFWTAKIPFLTSNLVTTFLKFSARTSFPRIHTLITSSASENARILSKGRTSTISFLYRYTLIGWTKGLRSFETWKDIITFTAFPFWPLRSVPKRP